MKINCTLPNVPCPKRLPLFLIAIVMTTTASFADDMADGKKFYNLHDYNKAAVSFEKAIAKNRKDAIAHYYLGGCYIAKRDYGEARAEYQSASELTKDVKVRDYCDSLVANLDSRNETYKNSGSSAGSSSRERDAHGAGWDVSGTHGGSADEILDRANQECEKLRAQKGAALAPISGDPRNAAEISAINDRYDKRMKEILIQAREQASQSRDRR